MNEWVALGFVLALLAAAYFAGYRHGARAVLRDIEALRRAVRQADRNGFDIETRTRGF